MTNNPHKPGATAAKSVNAKKNGHANGVPS